MKFGENQTVPTTRFHSPYTYLLLVPLLFSAARGYFSFEAGGTNDVNVMRYGALLTSKSAGDTAVHQVEVAAIFLVAGFLVITSWRKVLAVAQKQVAFSALAVYTVTSTLWSETPSHTLSYSIAMAVNIAICFYLVANYTSQEQMQLVMMTGWLVFSVSLILILFFPRYGVSNLDGAGAWQGLLSHKNTFAILSLFLLTPACFISTSSLSSRLLRLLYIAFAVVLIAMSQSRTGWIAAGVYFVIVAIVWIVQAFAPKDALVISATIMVAVIAAIIGAVLILPLLFQAIGKDATLTGRHEIWGAVIDAAMRRPILGYGYSGFFTGMTGPSASVSIAANFVVPHAHSGYLNVWVEQGAIGVLLVLGPVLLALWKGTALLFNAFTPAVGWYLSIIVVSLVINYDEPSWMMPNALDWMLTIVASIMLRRAASLKTFRTDNSASG